jgi:hypothetical protein
MEIKMPTEKEFIEMINKEAEKFEPSQVYKALKKYGIKRIYPSQIRLISICLVLRKYVKHITIKMLHELTGMTRANINPILRGLGDKNVLHLNGYGGNRDVLMYVVHPAFLVHCFPNDKTIAIEALKKTMELEE